MAQKDGTTYLLLGGEQGTNPAEGWRGALLDHVKAGRAALTLAPAPPKLVALADDTGTFAGLENPTGVAVAPDGSVYIADGKHDRLVRFIDRSGVRLPAHYFKISGGPHNGDRFAFILAASRLERWPRSIKREPASLDDVEVVSEDVWDVEMARCMILEIIGAGAAHDDCGCGCSDEAKSSSGGCGCGGAGTSSGSASAAKATSGSSCGCGGSSKGGGTPCTCGTKAETAGMIASEIDGLYPAHLPIDTLCATSSEHVACIGGTGTEVRRFHTPRGLTISSRGLMYVADSGNHRIQSFLVPSLVLKDVWGRRATAADVAAAAANAVGCDAPVLKLGDPVSGSGLGQFHDPWDVVVDTHGDLYIADRGNARVQKHNCRNGRFSAFDGTALAAHIFQVLYGPSVGKRWVYIPALRRLEAWPGLPGTIPPNMSGIVPEAGPVASVEDARVMLLKKINALGATDILVEWDVTYPAHLAADEPFKQPEHMVIDAAGLIYVTDAGRSYVKVIDAAGRVLDHVTYANQLQAEFPPAAFTLDAAGNLLVAGPDGIHRFAARGGTLRSRAHQPGCGCAHGCSCSDCEADERRRVCGTGEPGVVWTAPPSGYLPEGTYISKAFDSGIDRCQWHKIVIDYAAPITEGTTVKVWTFASQDPLTDAEIAGLAASRWRTGQLNGRDFLVLSGPGRYLWLKIEFKGDGVTTPALHAITVHYPRVTWLEYLPAIYQEDPVSKDFLERFLSIFETLFSSIEIKVDDLVRYLDPDGVPSEFLTWLAAWVDMTFVPAMSLETRRRLLRHSPELYRKRGTPEGLRMFIKLALGLDVRIQEGFRQRQWLFLDANGGGLGNRSVVWGDAIVARLELDQFATIGEFRLVSTGDPLRDPFHVFAHRFTVYVNASDCRDPSVERTLRYLLDQEKPAHTIYSLVKVEPRFRVGVQATIGLDTTIGRYPRTVLNECATLGCDTVLGGAPDDEATAATRVGVRSRTGINSVVG